MVYMNVDQRTLSVLNEYDDPNRVIDELRKLAAAGHSDMTISRMLEMPLKGVRLVRRSYQIPSGLESRMAADWQPDVDRIRDLAAAGRTDQEIATEIQSTVSRVHQARRTNGIKPGHQPRSFQAFFAEHGAEIEAMAREGMSDPEIATKLSVDSRLIFGCRTQNGIPAGWQPPQRKAVVIDDDLAETVRKLAGSGLTLERIADRTGITLEQARWVIFAWQIALGRSPEIDRNRVAALIPVERSRKRAAWLLEIPLEFVEQVYSDVLNEAA